ncbi:MAG TPA: DUF4351 domain-containing protein, partial [Bryobacteraceae bacterium]|nr:DUF4351 domain-containing protein [Bryobacteraceae bacterium]
MLGRLRNKHRVVREIVTRIAALEPLGRDLLLRQLLILAGLQRLEELIEGEAKKMPILESILEHKVLGREFKRGLKEGQQQGELKLILGMLEKRFGPLPESAEQKVRALPEPELLQLGLRLLDVQSLEEL